MTPITPSRGYTQARVQVRYSQLPDEALWRRLEPVRDLGSYLAEACTTPLGPWLAGITPRSEPDEIEHILSQRLAALVDECEAWLGHDWVVAIKWLRLLVRLPEMEAARREGQPPSDPATRPLETLLTKGRTLKEAWIAGWHERLPGLGRREGAALNGLVTAVVRHLGAFPAVRVRDAWAQRLELERQLRARFRQTPLQPAAAFCLLALTAMQLERLRAALLVRALFVSPVEVPVEIRE